MSKYLSQLLNVCRTQNHWIYIGTVHGTVLNGLTRWNESRYFYVTLSNFAVYFILKLI
jgi:hypothetical protein